jgi:hypothetical protein
LVPAEPPLAQDPANRVPMTWEVMYVHPAPERATYETDPRIADVLVHVEPVRKARVAGSN